MKTPDEMQTQLENTKRIQGELITVCSAKGGIGRTTLTINLAVALFKKNSSVAIFDGDFQFGDISLAMDLHAPFSMKEVIEGIETIDEQSLSRYLTLHKSGVRVLPAPERPEFADLVTKEAMEKVLDLMLQEHDYVIADTDAGLSEHSLYLIEKADVILVVTNLEMTALKNTKLLLETLETLGLRKKARVIINRANMESVINAVEAANILKETAPIYIPNDFQTCSKSLNIGVPFVIGQSKSEVAKGIFKMAESLTNSREASPNVPNKQHSVFSKWYKGGRSK